MKISVPLNKIYREANLCKKRYVILYGSAGSGKSKDTAINYILKLSCFRGRNLCCIRKSDITNRDSTYAELVSAIIAIFGSDYERFWLIKKSPLQLINKENGNQIIFRGVNDDKQREKLKSITFSHGKLTDVWIEEATELEPDDFEIIDDRLRGLLNPNLYYQIRMTFNPVSSSHWIKKRFFDRKDDDVYTLKTTYLDNRFIDEAFHKRMARRAEVDPEGYRIYGLGEWGELGKLIIDKKQYSIIEAEQDLSFYDDIAIGQDFGYNHANAILLLGAKDNNIYILKEIYEHEKDTNELIRIANDAGFPKNATMICDAAEPDRISMWEEAGYNAIPCRKFAGSVKSDIENLKGIVEDGSAIRRHIYIDASCVNTIAEIEKWRYKKDRNGKYLDEPISVDDDAMAALRYGAQNWNVNKSSYNKDANKYLL